MNILITGATGFLGSALCVDLSRDHLVFGVERRTPDPRLRRAAAGTAWEFADITDAPGVDALFERIVRSVGSIDVVLHFAAFYHFGYRWRAEYQAVNVDGTAHLLEAAARHRVGRFVFAGSIAALEPPTAGIVLTEGSTDGAGVAYARSKMMGEALLRRYAHRIPTLSLRIGGVFTDWCELPPLYSLIHLWSKPLPLGRMMPGRGGAGFPYLHRQDLVACVRRIVERTEAPSPHEVLLAAPDGCTRQVDLFPVVQAAMGRSPGLAPLCLSPACLRPFLWIAQHVKTISGRSVYEQPWMLDYADRPLVVDAARSHLRLDWRPRPGAGIVDRLPRIVHHFRTETLRWEHRNIRRNEGRYEYSPD